MSEHVELIQNYLKALSEGDLVTVSTFLSDDLVWHQPGNGALSGTFIGKEAVFTHLGDFAKLSNGTFAIDKIDYITANKNLVIIAIHFKASSEHVSIEMKGVDLFKIETCKIQEVWLFSEDIDTEDKFWTSLVSKSDSI